MRSFLCVRIEAVPGEALSVYRAANQPTMLVVLFLSDEVALAAIALATILVRLGIDIHHTFLEVDLGINTGPMHCRKWISEDVAEGAHCYHRSVRG
jgi:hypothetical protein